MTEEKFFCGGCDMRLPGQEEFPHTWVRDRWSAEEWVLKDHQQPRTCTGCGGIHPDDVLALMDAGFSDEPTTKGYKGYMHAPGYREELIAYHRSVDKAAMKANPTAPCPTCALEGTGDSILGKIKYPSDPIKGPPLKFYMWHFSAEQRAKLIEKSKAIRARDKAPWEG